MWNDDFEQRGSDMQDYIQYIIKTYGTLPSDLANHICVNSINNKLVFKIKDGYKLELQNS